MVRYKKQTCAVVQKLCNTTAQQKTAFRILITRFLERLCKLCRLSAPNKYLVQLVQKTQDNVFNLLYIYILKELISCTTAQLGLNLLYNRYLNLCNCLHKSAQLHKCKHSSKTLVYSEHEEPGCLYVCDHCKADIYQEL